LAEVGRLKSAPDEEIARRFEGWRIGASLDAHQLRNVAIMTISGGWGACVFDEQGTGKTLSVIGAFDRLVESRDIETLLVIAPKSMVGEWVREFHRFTADLYRVVHATGSALQKITAIHSRPDVIVANYEAAIAMQKDLELLCRRARVALVIDESFSIKNPDARRTAALGSIRESCDRAYVLCGTPAPHSARDLVAQFDLVDFGFTFGGVRLDADGATAARQVQSAITQRGVFVRNLKQVVLPNLPGRSYAEVLVEMAPRQASIYSALARQLIDELQAISDHQFDRDITNYFSRRAALLRVCSHPGPIIERYDEVPAKLAALDELVKRYVVDRAEKVVIWSHFKFSLDAIVSRYSKYGIAMIDGSVPDVNSRREAVRRFQEDEVTRIFVGNPAAAGAGLTLHRAHIAVYESLSSQAAHFMQSLDRIHRRGQNRSVEYVTLLCRDTIEITNYRQLVSKAEAQGRLLGDPTELRMTRASLLAELLSSTTPSA
jgi:SNF2 family DNA or RNA helicase